MSRYTNHPSADIKLKAMMFQKLRVGTAKDESRKGFSLSSGSRGDILSPMSQPMNRDISQLPTPMTKV